MSKRVKTQVESVSERAWQSAQKLIAAIETSAPPVQLSHYAKELSVRAVRFEPLLSDAGLYKAGEWWEVVINTEHTGRTTLALKALEIVDVGNWSKLTRALRFTVAHELSHLIFLKAAHKDQFTGDMFEKNEEAIENACNILARMLLLPRGMLMKEIGNRIFDVDHVCEILSSFAVSPQVFIRRLHLHDMNMESTESAGLLAFVEESQGHLQVNACHIVGTLARDRFQLALQRSKGSTEQRPEFMSLSEKYKQTRWELEAHLLRELKLSKEIDLEPIMRTKDRDEFKLDVDWGDNNVVPCSFAFRRIDHKHLSFLVRLQIVGPPRRRGQLL